MTQSDRNAPPLREATAERSSSTSVSHPTPAADRAGGHPTLSLVRRLWQVARTEVALVRPRQIIATTASRVLPQLTFNYSRTMILRSMGLKIGPRSLVMGPLRMTGAGEANKLLTIGADSVITGPVHIDFGAEVQIGNRVYIGHDVMLLTVDHKIGPVEQRCGPQRRLPIVIADGVWIGSRVTILPGVCVGTGSVVAAGSVVVRDVEPNCLVGGVPATVIRELDLTAPESTLLRRRRSAQSRNDD